jgi:hypothetical protein
MSAASDTPEERLAEYGRLFERALRRRERRADAVVLSFDADPATRSAVEDLVRREATCCPFLDYRIETVGEELRWTTTNPITGNARGTADVILDTLYALPDGGVQVVDADGGGFELRDAATAARADRRRRGRSRSSGR